ncbi:MAG: Cysteine desulfurase [Candidatus Heimdallarchaeota archaeon LC_2]|nr:MAG: Cysteine desulfurase [Candidatus Heimdallarchaeota archaeon LC_2]
MITSTTAEQRKQQTNLEPGVLYFNNASFGIWPKKTYDVVQKKTELMSQQGFLSFDPIVCGEEVEKIFTKFSKLINCSSSALALTNSTSDGMHLIATGLDLEKMRGKNIILNDLEFIANSFIWQQMAKKYKMQIVTVKSNNGRLLMSDFETAINDNLGLVAISSVQFSNGFRVNLKDLTELTHDHGGLIAVDAIQQVGALTFDTSILDIDFLTVGGYKWLCAPYGTGLIYVKPELQEKLDPIAITWHGDLDPMNMTHRDFKPFKDGRKFSTLGIASPSIFGLSVSLDHHLAWGPSNSEKYLFQITNYIINRFHEELEGFKLISPRDTIAESSQILAYKANIAMDELVNYLAQRKISCGLRDGNLRLAPHVYATRDDVDAMIVGIKDALKLS